MDMDIKLSLSPAITDILQNTPFENVKEPQFHQCFKQYSKLCSSSLIAVICSKRRKKTKKKALQHKDILHPRSLDWYCFTKSKRSLKTRQGVTPEGKLGKSLSTTQHTSLHSWCLCQETLNKAQQSKSSMINPPNQIS